MSKKNGKKRNKPNHNGGGNGPGTRRIKAGERRHENTGMKRSSNADKKRSQDLNAPGRGDKRTQVGDVRVITQGGIIQEAGESQASKQNRKPRHMMQTET